MGQNETIKPKLRINDLSDYFYKGHYDSSSFSLKFHTDNSSYYDNIYIEKITLNVSNLEKDWTVTLKNLKTLEKTSITWIPLNWILEFNMKNILVKKGELNFQLTSSAKWRFTIPKNWVVYHTEDGSIYTNDYWLQMGQNY